MGGTLGQVVTEISVSLIINYLDSFCELFLYNSMTNHDLLLVQSFIYIVQFFAAKASQYYFLDSCFVELIHLHYLAYYLSFWRKL